MRLLQGEPDQRNLPTGPFQHLRSGSAALGSRWGRASSAPAGLTIGHRRVAAEQAIEVVPHHGTLLAALLEQEPRQGGLHEPVLVPLGVIGNEAGHGLVEVLRKFIHNAHEGGGVVGDLAHATQAADPPIRPRRPGCRQKSSLNPVPVRRLWESQLGQAV